MAAGHVNRTTLESYYQQPGDVYDNEKTEGALETIALQVDDNYDEAHAVKTSLASTTDGSSGADYVKATAISGLTGGTVQALLKALKTYADGLSMGQVGDGVVTNAKLATDVKVGSLADLNTTTKTSVVAAINEHLAEDVSDGVHGMGTAAAEDYEEGTWTPEINFTTPTYTIQQGYYRRIGGLVFCTFRLELTFSDSGTNTGPLSISGVPFSIPKTRHSMVNLLYAGITLGTGYTQVEGSSIVDDATALLLYQLGSNKELGIDSFITSDKLASTVALSGTISYVINI